MAKAMLGEIADGRFNVYSAGSFTELIRRTRPAFRGLLSRGSYWAARRSFEGRRTVLMTRSMHQVVCRLITYRSLFAAARTTTTCHFCTGPSHPPLHRLPRVLLLHRFIFRRQNRRTTRRLLKARALRCVLRTRWISSSRGTLDFSWAWLRADVIAILTSIASAAQNHYQFIGN